MKPAISPNRIFTALFIVAVVIEVYLLHLVSVRQVVNVVPVAAMPVIPAPYSVEKHGADYFVFGPLRQTQEADDKALIEMLMEKTGRTCFVFFDTEAIQPLTPSTDFIPATTILCVQAHVKGISG